MMRLTMRWKCDWWCIEVAREPFLHVVYISNINRPQRPAWSVWYLVAAPGLLGAATGSPKHTPQDPNFPLLPETHRDWYNPKFHSLNKSFSSEDLRNALQAFPLFEFHPPPRNTHRDWLLIYKWRTPPRNRETHQQNDGPLQFKQRQGWCGAGAQ